MCSGCSYIAIWLSVSKLKLLFLRNVQGDAHAVDFLTNGIRAMVRG